MNELNTLLNATIIFTTVEIISNLTVFPILNKIYGMRKQAGEKMPPWFKGIIERMCLIIGISLNYPQILIAYGALKIGTKLGGQSGSSSDKSYTEYYLVGNLISIMIAFLTIYLMGKIHLF